MIKWLVLGLGIASNASASALIKVAMTPPRPLPSLADPFAVFYNWPLLLGVVLYGIAFVLYAVALALLPLNVAHPVLTSGAVASVALLSAFVFKESFHGTTWLGLGLIIAGVVIITTRA